MTMHTRLPGQASITAADMLTEQVQYMSQCAAGALALQQVPLLAYQYNPRELVYALDKVKLYHYRAHVPNPLATPVLVVFATVNRPEILDLFPETSFIGGLLKNGMDVYLLDWGYPDYHDRQISFQRYVTHYLHSCVKHIAAATPAHKINLLGICQGGLMCLCYATLSPYLKNLVLISTPVDFHTQDNTVAQFLNTIDMARLTKVFGNVPGSWLTQFFISLRPFELIGKKYLRFVDNINDQSATDRFLRVEKWLNDAPDQAGRAFRELAKHFYRDNKLVKGEIKLGNHAVSLGALQVPVLNVMASQDEIVPMSASQVLKNYVQPKLYSEQVYPSGHIGIYVSDKVGGRMSQGIAQWLSDKERAPKSKVKMMPFETAAARPPQGERD